MKAQQSQSLAIALEINTHDLTWQEDARCREAPQHLFFINGGAGDGYEAKRYCHRCIVIDQCLEYALETNQRFGIWGGLSAKERRRRSRSR